MKLYETHLSDSSNVYSSLFICINIYTQTYKYRLYIYIYIYIYTHTHKHTHIHIQTYIHTYIYLYIYTYTYIYIHTYVLHLLDFAYFVLKKFCRKFWSILHTQVPMKLPIFVFVGNPINKNRMAIV